MKAPKKRSKKAIKAKKPSTQTTAIALSNGKRPRCTAKSRQRQAQCLLTAAPGSTKCRHHGGATPKGISSPHFKHGRYSKHLPSQLANRYNAAKADPDLIGLRDEIALVTSMLDERLEKLYSGESMGLWKAMIGLLNEYGALMASDNTDDHKAAMVLFGDIQRIAKDGASAFAAFEQIESMIEQRRKLTESESKRLKDLDQNITVDKAMGIIQLLVSIVKKHVTDPKQLKAISAELAAAVD